ncbi:hypothetical protein L208DRAFT_1335762, partial [Tricholoma matsutake]
LFKCKNRNGAPKIFMYLLGLPDHYTSHIFAPFYWQAFVSNARSLCQPHSEHDAEHVTLLKQGNQVIGVSPVSDYIFHPAELDSIWLYNWVAHSKQVKKNQVKKISSCQG